MISSVDCRGDCKTTATCGRLLTNRKILVLTGVLDAAAARLHENWRQSAHLVTCHGELLPGQASFRMKRYRSRARPPTGRRSRSARAPGPRSNASPASASRIARGAAQAGASRSAAPVVPRPSSRACCPKRRWRPDRTLGGSPFQRQVWVPPSSPSGHDLEPDSDVYHQREVEPITLGTPPRSNLIHCV